MKLLDPVTGNAAEDGDGGHSPTEEMMRLFMEQTKAKEELFEQRFDFMEKKMGGMTKKKDRDDRRIDDMQAKMGGMEGEITALKKSTGRKKHKFHAASSSGGGGGMSITAMAFILGLLFWAFFNDSNWRNRSWGDAAPSPPTRNLVQLAPLNHRRHQQKWSEEKAEGSQIAKGERNDPVLHAAASAVKSASPRLVRGSNNIDRQNDPVDIPNNIKQQHQLEQHPGDVTDQDAPSIMQRKKFLSHSNTVKVAASSATASKDGPISRRTNMNPFSPKRMGKSRAIPALKPDTSGRHGISTKEKQKCPEQFNRNTGDYAIGDQVAWDGFIYECIKHNCLSDPTEHGSATNLKWDEAWTKVGSCNDNDMFQNGNSDAHQRENPIYKNARSTSHWLSSLSLLDVPACEGADPNACGCAIVKQADYRGSIETVSWGESDKTEYEQGECATWPEEMVKTYPDAGLDDGSGNYCRNPTPDIRDHAWCYGKSAYDGTMSESECRVPTCGDDRSALKDFFDSANGPQWINNANWEEENSSHCDWFGVTCDESNRTIKLDLQDNGLTGTLSKRIGELYSLHLLDLSNNNIKGPIPSEIKWLRNLSYLSLSYNTFKGDVDLDFDRKQQFELFHVHGNMISGVIEFTHNPGGGLSSFVADCGEPAIFDLKCTGCAMCCNSQGYCREAVYSDAPDAGTSFVESFKEPQYSAIIFMFLIVALLLLAPVIYTYYKCKNHFSSTPSIRSSPMVDKENEFALDAIGQDSVYRFFLTQSWWGWILAFATIVMQILTIFPFLAEAGTHKSTWQCLPNVLKCIDTSNDITPQGWAIFALMMAVHLLKDLINGFKLIDLSARQGRTFNERIRFFLGGMFLILVSTFTLFVSVIFIMAEAVSDTDLIKDSVVILFVMEVDERIYGVLSAINRRWTDQTAKTDRAQDFKNEIEELRQVVESLRLQIEGRGNNNAESQDESKNSHGDNMPASF